MRADRELDEFAARQYGVISRDQALRAGMTPKMITTRLQNGAWIRLAPSVYALASAPPKWERQLAAALLTKDEAIAAGRSAAFLHGFEGFGIAKPVIMIGPGGNARSPVARVIRSERFHEVGRIRRQGFVATDEAETLMTLAGTLAPQLLEGLVDGLLARKSVTVADLSSVVGASTGMRGVARLRRIVERRLPDAYQPPTSELERLLFGVLDDPRLPEYVRQVPFRYTRVDATVDAYVGVWRLIVEGDGRRWHTRRADFDRDRLRDNEATAHGIAVLRFTYEMLRDDREGCIDTLLRTGRVRAPS